MGSWGHTFKTRSISVAFSSNRQHPPPSSGLLYLTLQLGTISVREVRIISKLPLETTSALQTHHFNWGGGDLSTSLGEEISALKLLNQFFLISISIAPSGEKISHSNEKG